VQICLQVSTFLEKKKVFVPGNSGAPDEVPKEPENLRYYQKYNAWKNEGRLTAGGKKGRS